MFRNNLLTMFYVCSGPASIVYNESGHRADEEEGDSGGEDEGGNNSRLRSAVTSRAPSRDEQAAPIQQREVELPVPEQQGYRDAPNAELRVTNPSTPSVHGSSASIRTPTSSHHRSRTASNTQPQTASHSQTQSRSTSQIYSQNGSTLR